MVEWLKKHEWLVDPGDMEEDTTMGGGSGEQDQKGEGGEGLGGDDGKVSDLVRGCINREEADHDGWDCRRR